MMKQKLVVLSIVWSLLLGGCGWYNGEYLSVSPHREGQSDASSDTHSAANYHQLRQILSGLVTDGTESAVIHVAEYQQELVEAGMDAAVHYIRELLPLGAYAVEEIQYEIGNSGGQPAISVAISYRHGRSELRKIQTAADMPTAVRYISNALDQCDDSLVIQVEDYTEMDLVQMVEDYARTCPDRVMEIPQVAVGVYPDTGRSRVVELVFTYTSSRDALRQMQTMVERVFVSAALYVNDAGNESQQFNQLYTFLADRFDYKIETSITPSYSLLCYGVGDSEAFATVFAAMCRATGLECYTVSGTCDGEARYWNLICEGERYYHVDLLKSRAAGGLKKRTDAQMEGYVWDYSAYPAADGAPVKDYSE